MDEIIGQMVIRDPKGLMQQEFKCPKCGSPFFRTIDNKNKVRECKGFYWPEYNEYSGCDFTWKDNGDNKYFHKKVKP